MIGRVFSIEEFSVYDGPGIRTTVFFKGCPLKCTWCHSPEGQSFEKEILKSPNGCLECKCCEKVCENYPNCILCEKCIKACPRNLIRVSGTDYTVKELATLLRKNFKILNMNDGGLTFSGGEPLSQGKFLLELIKEIKGETSLAIQTSGYGESKLFKEIIDNLDLVLFDMKIMDHKKALEFEGINNQLIFDNLEILKNSSTPFIIRIPLIPTIIDTKENLTEIINKIKGSKNLIQVELLPYNKFAGSKYALAKKEYKPNFDESIESNPHLDLFEKHNIKVRVL